MGLYPKRTFPRLYCFPEITIADRIHYLVAFTALTTGGEAF